MEMIRFNPSIKSIEAKSLTSLLKCEESFLASHQVTDRTV